MQRYTCGKPPGSEKDINAKTADEAIRSGSQFKHMEQTMRDALDVSLASWMEQASMEAAKQFAKLYDCDNQDLKGCIDKWKFPPALKHLTEDKKDIKRDAEYKHIEGIITSFPNLLRVLDTLQAKLPSLTWLKQEQTHAIQKHINTKDDKTALVRSCASTLSILMVANAVLAAPPLHKKKAIELTLSTCKQKFEISKDALPLKLQDKITEALAVTNPQDEEKCDLPSTTIDSESKTSTPVKEPPKKKFHIVQTTNLCRLFFRCPRYFPYWVRAGARARARAEPDLED